MLRSVRLAGIALCCSMSSVARAGFACATAGVDNLLPPSADEQMAAARAHVLRVEADFVTCTQ